jgi:hypothetical protein
MTLTRPADMNELADALQALLDPTLPVLSPLGWIFGASNDAPAGLDAVAMIAASPATRAGHRSILMQALRHTTETADAFLDPVHGYLAARKDRVRRLDALHARHGPAPWHPEGLPQLTADTGPTRSQGQRVPRSHGTTPAQPLLGSIALTAGT